MPTVLVTGSTEGVDPVLDAVRAAGAGAIGLTDPARLVEDLRALEPGSVSCYVQLPVALTPEGDNAVTRVHSFLEQGLLTRFVLADAARPALSAEASVVLVGGHTPLERQAPDDQGARLALLNVLAHAIRADRAPTLTRVRVLDHSCTAAEIADLAVTGRAPRGEQPTERSAEALRAYQDWRTELVALASVEI